MVNKKSKKKISLPKKKKNKLLENHGSRMERKMRIVENMGVKSPILNEATPGSGTSKNIKIDNQHLMQWKKKKTFSIQANQHEPP